MTSDKVISPFTKKEYEIRELDPFVISSESKPDTPEVKILRQEVDDIVKDIEEEQDRVKKTKKENPKKLAEFNKHLDELWIKIGIEKKVDGDEMTRRRKILGFGVVKPKIETLEQFLDLGVDGSWLYTVIIKKSKYPDGYAEVIRDLFR